MKVSIAIPWHNAPNTAFFLSRLLRSLDAQSYKDYEVVLTNKGSMGENHCEAVAQSKGDLIKLMQMDDYFAHPLALEHIVNSFKNTPDKHWLISGNLHFDGEKEGYPHLPEWNDKIYTGRNTLGSVSTITMRPGFNFDPTLKWMIDVDLYWRLYQAHGLPILSRDLGVVVSWHPGQQTNLLSDELKRTEFLEMMKRYDK